MPKKKPEMSQVYNQSNNEFIFGENGGRGKHLTLFLRNLSLTGSLHASEKHNSETVREANSSIYGQLGYGYSGSESSGMNLSNLNLGLASSQPHLPKFKRSTSLHLVNVGRDSSPDNHDSSLYRVTRVSSSTEKSRARAKTYTDLDDDWDAQIERKERATEKASHRSAVALEPEKQATPAKAKSPKFEKLAKILSENATVDLQELRKLAWNGICPELRAVTWQLLLGYLPANKTRQSSTLKRKRQEYCDGLRDFGSHVQFDDAGTSSGSSTLVNVDSTNKDNSVNREKQLYHQINIDVKRTNPTIPLYSLEATQKSLRKILFFWAIRHPASGYVQGINDLCTPFYQIFLANYLWQLQNRDDAELSRLFIPGLLDEADEKENELLNDPNLQAIKLETFETSRLSERVASMIEADTFWCLSRLLDNITDNYIHEQPGIMRQVNDLRNLIAKIDLPLLQHLENEGVEFLQFAFRWMNCLLMRELNITLIIRIWDTYLSESPLGFSNFHVYVCAAFLVRFSEDLRERDFQEILLFLQNPPTASWKEKDVELLMSEGFLWQSLYKDASAHLR